MQGHRIIPLLLLSGTDLVKTQQFKRPRYVGDILNAIAIFNSKMADEIIILDVTATPTGSGPNLELIEEIAAECFMPMCYGGGISSVREAEAVLSTGAEKVSLNSAIWRTPELVGEIARAAGSQSVVASIDAVGAPDGSYWTRNGSTGRAEQIRPWEHAARCVELGAGELVLQCVDRDGMRTGFDIDLIRQVTDRVDVPVIAGSGADTVDDLAQAIIRGGAQAVAAGSMFVFYGRLQSVLITMPDPLAVSEAIHSERVAANA